MTDKTPTVYLPQAKPQVRPNADQRRRLTANGAAIHHINGDPSDNSIENLRVVYVRERE